MINDLLKKLEGKKTYISAALIAVIVFLWFSKLINDELAAQLLTLLGAGGIAALRAGISK